MELYCRDDLKDFSRQHLVRELIGFQKYFNSLKSLISKVNLLHIIYLICHFMNLI